jgi:electron transfer flavoprotein alpha subunit
MPTPALTAQVLAVVEAPDGIGPRPSALRMLTFAKEFCEKSSSSYAILVMGHELEALATELRHYGATQVLVVDDVELAAPLAELAVPTIARIATELGASVVIGAATPIGKDWFPRLAGQLDAAFVGDCCGVEDTPGTPTLLRPINAGNVTAHCHIARGPLVITVRTTEFAPACPEDSLQPSSRQTMKLAARTAAAKRVQWLRTDTVENSRPPLGEARVVVSGGRALASKFFDVLGPLADSLGAAIGATRAACDAGFAPGDFQVGQTGCIVAPELYVAVGISGAIQHTAGMKGARTVVAINSDPGAPIFGVADYGLIGDLFELVPELVGAIDAYRKSGT